MGPRIAAALLFALAAAAEDAPVLKDEYALVSQVDQETKSFVLLAAAADHAKVAPLRNKIQAELDKVKASFAAQGFAPLPDPLYIMILGKDRLKVAGQADRPYYLALQTDFALSDTARPGVLAHECYHHVQNGSLFGCEEDQRTITYRHWADEATAEWIQYKLYPGADLPLQRAARVTMESFRGPFFTRITEQHAYFSYTFFAYLDPAYDSMSLLRRFFVNPEKDKPGRKLFADPMELLDRAVIAPARPGGVPRRLPEVFVDYLIQARWKKECEPWRTIFAHESLAAECATQIGKPGALKFDRENMVAWNIPWDEGGKRLKKKEFDRVSGESYGIVKEYNISSMTKKDKDPKKDEVGDLHLSVRKAKGGNARIVVFPFDDSGILEARVGAPGAPVVVKGWERMGGAAVWIVDVTADGRVDYQLTADFKSGDWAFVVEDMPLLGISGLGFRSVRLMPGEPMPKESDEARKLAGKWIHATLEVDGKTQHLYGKFTDEGVAWFSAPYARMKPGTYPWKLKTSVDGVAVETSGTSVVGLSVEEHPRSVEEIRKTREEIVEAEKDYAAAEDPGRKERAKKWLASRHEYLAHGLLNVGRFEEAQKEAEKAIELDPADRDHCYYTLGHVRLAAGDVDGFVAWLDKASRSYETSQHYAHAAHGAVAFHGDLARAWAFAEKHDAKMKALGKPGFNWPIPRPGEEILK